MKKKTKKILAVVAAIFLVLGIIAYEAASLYFPLKYKNDYTPVHSQLINKEDNKNLLTLRNALANDSTKTDETISAKIETSCTLGEVSIPEKINNDDLAEKLLEAFDLTEKTKTVTYDASYITPFFDCNSAFTISGVSDLKITEKEDGFTEYEVELYDEVYYFTGLYLWKVYPYTSSMGGNQLLFGFVGPDTDEIKDLTKGAILRNADITFSSTVLKFTLDKDGNIVSIHIEMPIKCTAKLMTGLFGREEVSAELTKIITYTFE